jgi:signal transduction histidine kinase
MHAPSHGEPGGDKADDMFAVSIVHEIRQPLSAIVASAAAGSRFLDHSPPDLDRVREAFRRIVADVERAGALIEDIGANVVATPSPHAAPSIDSRL